MAKFKVGTPVWLNSGGPKMSAGVTDASGLVECSWFDGPKLERGVFHEDQLRDDDPKPKNEYVGIGDVFFGQHRPKESKDLPNPGNRLPNPGGPILLEETRHTSRTRKKE